MSELKPTTKMERNSVRWVLLNDLADSISGAFALRILADIDRRDEVLRRLVEWNRCINNEDDEEDEFDRILAAARAELEGTQ